MADNSVLYELEEYVAWITLNNPLKGNVVNNDNLPLISDFIESANDDGNCRVIVLQGKEGVFSRGMDFENLIKNSKVGEIKNYFTDPYKKAVLAIRNSNKPVIAAIDGDVLAGGMGLVLASDIVISTKRSIFGLSEALFGIIPAFVFPFLLERTSYKRARYMVLSTKKFSAEDAFKFGIVDEITDDDRLNKSIKDIIKRLLYSSPAALALTKKYSDELTNNKISEAVDFAQNQLTELLNVEENVNNIKSFIEGEKPGWAISYKGKKS
ncbi:MAG: enoyl-CoA hydratase/isomerase family protein [Spirochaetes bacterium]|nr:enoyl-CoA hydratase/isomerase family protein [Spirochaetota bacterium]